MRWDELDGGWREAGVWAGGCGRVSVGGRMRKGGWDDAGVGRCRHWNETGDAAVGGRGVQTALESR